MIPDNEKLSEPNGEKLDRFDKIMLCVLMSIALAIAFLVTSLVSTIPGSNLPLWVSAMIGIIIAGSIAWFTSVGNSHTLLDTIMTLFITLVLCAALVPVFKQAQKKAQMKKAKSAVTYQMKLSPVRNYFVAWVKIIR